MLGGKQGTGPPAPADRLFDVARTLAAIRLRRPGGIGHFAKPAAPAADHAGDGADRDEAETLAALGLPKPLIALAANRARLNATSIETELLRSKAVDPTAYYAALAKLLNIPLIDAIPAEQVVATRRIDANLQRPLLLRLSGAAGGETVVVAAEAAKVDHIRHFAESQAGLKDRLAIAPPAAIRRAVWDCRAGSRVAETTQALFRSQPAMSARIVMTGWQGFVAGAAVSLGLTGLILSPAATLLGLHLVMTVFFFACVAMRVMAIPAGRRTAWGPIASPHAGGLPTYTVLVTLYREAPVARQLVAALSRLRWPRSRLEIKFVCEADDGETIAALEALKLPPEYEIVLVPAGEPRTKPKALAYALAGATGSFAVIFDAEDRPHPDQLLEAYARFCRDDRQLACLQAPLVVSNAGRNALTAVFAIEYAGLFRALLPMLAHHELPAPLGGTSNHFRMEALRRVGGWDPYNVTEDADLGMRLYRLGYRVGTITRPTLEDAPDTAAIWMSQRTRWFKGWAQTWLVMMRNPLRLWQQMGPAAFVIAQLLMVGMLFSTLAHPLLIAFIGSTVLFIALHGYASATLAQVALFVVDCANVIGGYTAFVMLGHRVMTAHERRNVRGRWIHVPVYWVLMSVAAWKAVFELSRNPFFWAKTPHRPSAVAVPSAGT